jgi:hypothetical protein
METVLRGAIMPNELMLVAVRRNVPGDESVNDIRSACK